MNPLILVFLLLAQTSSVGTQPDMKALEARGNTEFEQLNCTAAEKTYAEAIRLSYAAGDLSRVPFYDLRIGSCLLRRGDFAGGLEVYRDGIRLTEASGDNPMLELHVHGAALALGNLRRYDEVDPLVDREYELARQSGRPENLARALWMRSAVYLRLGRIRDELDVLQQALVMSRATVDYALTAVLLDTLANAYNALGDLETAARIENQILAIPEKELLNTSTYSRAITYNNLGDVQLKSGHRAEARKSFEQAIAGSTRPERWRVRSTALLNMAGIQNEAGQIADADASFAEALRIAKSVNYPDLETCAWQMRSDDLLIRGDLAGAADAGAKAVVVARQMPSVSRTYRALVSLGNANAAAGAYPEARGQFDEALGIAETVRAQSPVEISDLSRSYANLVPLYQASVRNLFDLHLPTEAFQRAEEAKARVLMDILRRGGVDEAGAMTPAESGEQVKLRKRLEASRGADQHIALTDFRQFRRALYTSHPELAVKSADFEAASVEKLAALLPGTKSALLDFFFVPSGVMLFVVRRAQAGAGPSLSTYFLPDPKHTLAAEARAFRVRLANRDLSYKMPARHLFNRLIAPAMAELRGTTEWIVSPDQALWEVPFAVLLDPAGRHLIETRAIVLTPSLTAALQLRQRPLPPAAPIGLLAFGNPLPSPQPLPDAALEVTEIGARYPRGSALVLTGRSATAAAFREKAPSARIIHLAAHAGLNDIDPLSSAVQLGAGSSEDGSLTALAMMSLHLRADMVVLSACETALGRAGPGEGVMGMGWALSAAGASSSVLSLWKVDSVASRNFMTSFYANLSSQSRSDALRNASLAMLRSPLYRHPFYWAAFTIQGQGS